MAVTPSSLVTAAIGLPKQIEAHLRVRRVALHPLVEGIGVCRPQSAPPLIFFPAWSRTAVCRRACSPPIPATPYLAVRAVTLRVSLRVSGTCPLLFFLPLSPCLRSSVAAVRNRRRRTSPEPFPATSWSISPPLVFPENGSSIAPSRASPRAGSRRALARRRRRSPRHRAGRGMPSPGQTDRGPPRRRGRRVAADLAVAHQSVTVASPRPGEKRFGPISGICLNGRKCK